MDDSHLLRGCGYVGASVGFVSGASFCEVFQDFVGKILLVSGVLWEAFGSFEKVRRLW